MATSGQSKSSLLGRHQEPDATCAWGILQNLLFYRTFRKGISCDELWECFLRFASVQACLLLLVGSWFIVCLLLLLLHDLSMTASISNIDSWCGEALALGIWRRLICVMAAGLYQSRPLSWLSRLNQFTAFLFCWTLYCNSTNWFCNVRMITPLRASYSKLTTTASPPSSSSSSGWYPPRTRYHGLAKQR